MSKYGNIKTEINGYVFDSKREANRYMVLLSMEQSGEISDLIMQYPLDLRVQGGKIVGKYYADFRYTKNGKFIYEDSKGVRTAVYRLKKKIVEAVYNIKIEEV